MKILIYLTPLLIAAQTPFVFYEMYKAVTLLFGMISLMIGSVATYSGLLFRKSLGEYFSGSYINNVRPPAIIDFLGQTERHRNHHLFSDPGDLRFHQTRV